MGTHGLPPSSPGPEAGTPWEWEGCRVPGRRPPGAAQAPGCALCSPDQVRPWGCGLHASGCPRPLPRYRCGSCPLSTFLSPLVPGPGTGKSDPHCHVLVQPGTCVRMYNGLMDRTGTGVWGCWCWWPQEELSSHLRHEAWLPPPNPAPGTQTSRGPRATQAIPAGPRSCHCRDISPSLHP